MTIHTPGPWKLTEGEYFYINARVDGRKVFILQRTKSVVSAATAYQEAEEDRIRADCQLIAAAPELLEACQIALDSNDRSVKDVLRAAITKATGVAHD